MKLNSLIIDDFLDDPDQIRNFLINNKVPFEIKGPYPGKRTTPVDNIGYQNMVIEKLNQVLPFKIKMRPLSFPFQLCLSDDKTWVHIDSSDWTGVLYLTPNAPLDSGTLFFTADDEIMETIRKGETGMLECKVASTVGNFYNRMLLFRGGDIPHRSDVAGFGDGLENGRLTQVFFFDEVR